MNTPDNTGEIAIWEGSCPIHLMGIGALTHGELMDDGRTLRWYIGGNNMFRVYDQRGVEDRTKFEEPAIIKIINKIFLGSDSYILVFIKEFDGRNLDNRVLHLGVGTKDEVYGTGYPDEFFVSKEIGEDRFCFVQLITGDKNVVSMEQNG